MDCDLQANFKTMMLQPPQQNEWYLDSKATTTMTFHAGILTLHIILSMVVGNRHSIAVTSIGNVTVPH